MATWDRRCPEGTDQGGQFMPAGAGKGWCNEGGGSGSGSGKDGSKSSEGGKKDGEAREAGSGGAAGEAGKYAPEKETRERQTNKMRDVLARQLSRYPGLKGHRDELVRAARFLAYEDDDWANDWFADMPLRLKGEAKRAVASALESVGVKVSYTRYEDGSRAPTGIVSRPSQRGSRSKEMNGRMRKARQSRGR